MRTHAMKTRYALGAMLLALLLAIGASLAGAQGSAPTATLIASQPSFVAGTPATLKGMGFAPGEIVALEITHVRGTPVAGDQHGISTVAGAEGSFTATWRVCAADCVGELLRIKATGRTSGKVGRAMFMDLPATPA